MVHRHLAVQRLADFYLVFIIVVYGLSVNFPVRKAVATAVLYIVQNVGHAIVHVLGWVAVALCKERIFRCTLFQIHLYRSLEMVCSFHIVKFLSGCHSDKVCRSPPLRQVIRKADSVRSTAVRCHPRW